MMNPIHAAIGDQLFDAFTAGISDQAICMVDEGGKITIWNTGAQNFYQYSEAEIKYQSISLLLKGQEPGELLKLAFANGTLSLEADIGRKDGSSFPAHVSFKSIYEDGCLQGYAFTAHSLAYTRKLSHSFNATKAKVSRSGLFQELIEHSYSGVTLLDAELNFTYRSPSAARITGFNEAGRINLTFNEIVHPADQVRIKHLLEDLRQKPGSSFTCQLRSRHFDGHFIYLEGVFTNWLHEKEIGAIVLNFRDITDSKQTENILQQTVNELSAYKYALDASAIVAITDEEGTIRHVNDNFCDITGYSAEELLGGDHRMVNSGHHDKAFMKELWVTISAGKIWEGDICNRRKDGSTYWVSTTIVPFLNDQGKPYQYLAIRFDCTEAKAAKQELIEKNAQIGNLLESINDGFVGLDRDLRYTYVNRRACEMVGLTAEAMLGRKMQDLFPDAWQSASGKAVQQAIETGLPVTIEDYYAPSKLWWESHIYPNEGGVSVFISDITDRKNEEEQKSLLADIAHIFNQTGALPQLMEQVMRQLIAMGDRCCLAETWLLGRDGKQLNLFARTATNDLMLDLFSDLSNVNKLSVGQGLPGTAWATGSVIFWPNLENHPVFVRREGAKKAGLLSAFGIPLHYNGRLIGVLLLGHTCAERPDQLNNLLLTRLGNQLGTAISRRQLENDLQDIFEVSPDIICIVGTDRYFKKVNPAMCALLGYSESQLLMMPIDELIHPEDLQESVKRMRAFITGELHNLYFENRYLNRSGRTIYLAWTAAKGKEEGVLFCVAKDISDKKELERLLVKTNELARIGSWEMNLSTDEVFWSDVTAHIMEVSPGYRLLRGNGSLFYADEDLQKLNAGMKSVIDEGTPFDLELQLITANKNKRWVRVLAEGEFEDGICTRIYGSLQDIDDRKRAELAANRFLAERNSILESIGDAFFSVDREWNVQYWNQIAEQVLQTPKENILGKNLWSVFPHAVGSQSYMNYKEAMASGKAIHFEYPYPGQNKWYDINVYPSESGLSIFFKDITLRKNAEQELRVQTEALKISHQRYADLFQLSPLPMFLFDTENFNFLDVNEAAVNHYGYSRGEFLSMTLYNIRPETEYSMLTKVVETVERPTVLYRPGIFTHIKKSGELIKVEITSTVIDYGGRRARIALAMDVTERLIHLEAIELQNKKLREISWMQSHIMRAPLSRMMGLIELMESTSPNEQDTIKILQFIKDSANELDVVVRAIVENAEPPLKEQD